MERAVGVAAERTDDHLAVVLGHGYLRGAGAWNPDALEVPVLQHEAALKSGVGEIPSHDVTGIVDSTRFGRGRFGIVKLGELAIAEEERMAIDFGILEACCPRVPVRSERAPSSLLNSLRERPYRM